MHPARTTEFKPGSSCRVKVKEGYKYYIHSGGGLFIHKEETMNSYNCAVTEQDTLRAYETEDGDPSEPLFALVIENPMTNAKASVLLRKEACIQLASELINYAKG